MCATFKGKLENFNIIPSFFLKKQNKQNKTKKKKKKKKKTPQNNKK